MLNIYGKWNQNGDNNNKRKLYQHRKGVKGEKTYNESLPSCESQVNNKISSSSSTSTLYV